MPQLPVAKIDELIGKRIQTKRKEMGKLSEKINIS